MKIGSLILLAVVLAAPLAHSQELATCDIDNKNLSVALDLSEKSVNKSDLTRKLFVTVIDPSDKKAAAIDNVSTIVFDYTGLQENELKLQESSKSSAAYTFKSVRINIKSGVGSLHYGYRQTSACVRGKTCVQHAVNERLINCKFRS